MYDSKFSVDLKMAEIRRDVSVALGWTRVNVIRFTMDEEVSWAVCGIPPEFAGMDQTYSKTTPDYPTDISVCVEALDDTGADWIVRNYDDVMMRRRKVCELDVIEAEGDTYALACCAALLEYYKRKAKFMDAVPPAPLTDADGKE